MSDMLSMADAATPEQMQTEQDAFAGGAPQPTGTGGADVSGGDMQAMFETVATPLVEYIQGQGRDQIVELLGSTEDVGRNAGNVVGKMLLSQLQNAKNEGGKTIPPQVVGQTGLQVANVLADLGIESGIIAEEEGDAIADDAFYNGMADMAEMAPEGLIPPEHMQVYAQMIEELQMAEGDRDSGGDSGGMGMNAGIGDGMGASNTSMAAQTAPGAPTETASAMNAGMYDGNPNGGSLNG